MKRVVFAILSSTTLVALRVGAEPLPATSATPAPVAPPASAEPASPAKTDDPPPVVEPAPEAAASQPDEPTELTVVGTKETETGGSVHTIKRKALERFEYDDPQAILLGVPGVYARGEDGLGLRPNLGIRGGNSDRSKKVTLLEDGVLFGPAPYSAPAAYYFPIMTRMRSVRVVKGPAAIVYGPQTIGGAIDFLTEDVPETTSASVDGAIGQYGYNKLHARAGTTSGDVGFLIEGVHLANTGFKELDGGGDTGFVRNEWMAKASWQLPGSARLQHGLGLKLGYSDERSNESYLGLTDADFRATPYRRYFASKLDRMTWNRTTVVGTHHARFALDQGGALEIVTSAYRHDLHRVWRKVNGLRGTTIADVLADPSSPANALWYGLLTGARDSGGPSEAILIGPNDRTFVSQGVQTVARWTTKGSGWENRLEWGARLHYDHIRRLHTEDAFLVEGGNLVKEGATATTANNLAATTALAMYFADAFAWKRLVLTPGVRVEIIRSRLEDYLGTPETAPPRAESVGTAQVVLPGLGAYYGVTKELGVLAGVHRGFSPPPPGASSVTRPEDSINYEGGVRWTQKRLRAEVLGFFNDYRNLTDVCTFSNGCVGADLDRQFDAGAVHVWGAEAYVEGEIRPTKGFVVPARLSYTYTRSRFLSSFPSQDPQFGDVTEGDELPYVPRHQLSAMVGLETKRWGLAGQTFYVGQMREIAGQGPLLDALSTDAYVLFDASGWVRLTPWLRVYVNGRNLGGAEYLVSRRPFGARPGAPRWIQLGLKIDL